jgi:hypothetical protein
MSRSTNAQKIRRRVNLFDHCDTLQGLIPCEIAHYYVLRVLIGKIFQEIGMAMSQDLAMV